MLAAYNHSSIYSFLAALKNTNHGKCIKVIRVEMLQGCKNSHSKSPDSLSSSSVCVCSSRVLLKKKIQLTVFYKNAKNEIESIKISNSSYQARQTWKITLQNISINPSCSKGHKNINSIKTRR